MKVQIRYQPKLRRYLKIFSSLWIFLGLGAIIARVNLLMQISYPLLGIGYLFFLLDLRDPFLTISSSLIIKHGLFPKKIQVSQINEIKYFAGTYTITHARGKMEIDKDKVHPEDLERMDAALRSLPVRWVEPAIVSM